MCKILITSNTTWNIYNFRISLIKELINLNYKIFIISPSDEYVEELLNIGITFYNIEINQKGTNPISDIFLLRKYYQLIKKINPDMILSYTIKPNIYSSIVSRFLGIKNINNISGLGTLFINENFFTLIAKILYKISVKHSYHTFFQNNDDRELFLKNNLIFQKKSSIVPGSGLNPKKYQNFKKSNKAESFLFVGRLLKDKGVIEYLKAAILVLKKFPEKKFFLVGELGYNNKTSIKKLELEHYIKKSDGKIIYLGKTNNINSALKDADIFVLPSYREGLSRSILEACAMCLPVITTNVPGCKDIVEDNLNGVLCQPRSVESLYNSMIKIINTSSENLVRMGLNGRSVVENNFSSQIVNKIYLDKIHQYKTKM